MAGWIRSAACPRWRGDSQVLGRSLAVAGRGGIELVGLDLGNVSWTVFLPRLVNYGGIDIARFFISTAGTQASQRLDIHLSSPLCQGVQL